MSQMLTVPLALPQATRLPQGDQEGAVSAGAVRRITGANEQGREQEGDAID